MSRNTQALLAKILIILSMMAVVYSGFWLSIIWLFMGGISQMYGAEHWATVEFVEGITKVVCSGPALCLVGLAFTGLMRSFDKVGDWQRGRA